MSTLADFHHAVAEFFTAEGINCLSTIEVADEDPAEPYFSWRACECCGSSLGGDREDCNGYNPKTKEIQGPYSVCTDCLLYITNGDDPELWQRNSKDTPEEHTQCENS